MMVTREWVGKVDRKGEGRRGKGKEKDGRACKGEGKAGE